MRWPAWLPPVILLTPGVGLLVLFVLAPLVVVLVLSLYNYNLLAGTSTFVGVDNYRRILENGDLLGALWNTLLYTLISVPVVLTIALLAALGITYVGRGSTFWRTAYFMPAASTLAAMAAVWGWMFYPKTGVVDATLGVITGWTDWLNSTTLALAAVALVGSWQSIGFALIMFLAGLNNVNPSVLEAAKLDRAGAWSRLWHVIIPALGPALVFSIVVSTRDALRVFDQIQVMTQGGPVGSSSTLSFLMWQRAIKFNDFGGGSVISVVLLLLVLIVTFLQLRTFGRRLEEQGSR